MRRRVLTVSEAWCAACKEMHPKSSFGRDRNTADGLARVCRAIVSRRNRSYHQRHASELNASHKTARRRRKTGNDAHLWAVKKLVADARRRAASRGLVFDLSPAELEMPNVCPLLGIPLIYQADQRRVANSASIDRKDSSRGYVRDNCWIISWRANQIKSDATPQELRQLADALGPQIGKKAAGALLDGREWKQFPDELTTEN